MGNKLHLLPHARPASSPKSPTHQETESAAKTRNSPERPLTRGPWIDPNNLPKKGEVEGPPSDKRPQIVACKLHNRRG